MTCICCEPCACACRIASLVILALAVAISCLTNVSCDFMVSGNASVGLFYYTGSEGTCVEYPDNFTFDEFETAARSCGALASSVGCAIFLMMVWETFFCDIPCGKIVESVGLAIAAGCQGATFLMFASESLCQQLTVVGGTMVEIENVGEAVDYIQALFDTGLENDCHMGASADYSITAMVLFAACSIIACFSFRPDPLCS